MPVIEKIDPWVAQKSKSSETLRVPSTWKMQLTQPVNVTGDRIWYLRDFKISLLTMGYFSGSRPGL